MKTLKAKILLLVLALGALTVLPTQLFAGGNPIPICGDQYCTPPVTPTF